MRMMMFLRLSLSFCSSLNLDSESIFILFSVADILNYKFKN